MIFKKNKSNELQYELFKSPTEEFRGLPFWSWNCKLNKKTIDEQLGIFKEMGFGGVVIHPRDGLDTEYLGVEFMDMIKHAVDQCRKMELICWLYDDDRFPSGAADGLVTKNVQFRARQIRLTTNRLKDGYCISKAEFDKEINNGQIPRGYYLTAYSVKIQGRYLDEYHRLNNEKAVSAAIEKGENIRFAYLELAAEEEWFQGQTYSDTMNPAAVDEFIKITHEQYKNVLGTDFGTAASAIFTDEPRIGKQNTLSESDSEEDVFIPYTDFFAEQFKEKYNFEALDIIPEYIWNRQDGDMKNRYIYHNMLTECFSCAFMDKISAWCKEHGILMTGHILGEETLYSQTIMVGDAMRTYKNMDIPGIDILIDGRELSTVKQASSVAAQYGREAVMSELYGVTNWDCTFKTYKLQGDWQAALGITIRIPHLSHMSLEGEAKRDWPASIFYQSPWYKEFSYIENHFARLNTALARGKRIARIAVIHPVESMWIKIGNDDVNDEIRKSLDRDFADLTKLLLYNTLDFDYLSEALLPEQCTKSREKRLKVGFCDYDVVVVPDMLTIRDTTLDIIEQFAEDGGKIIFAGSIPHLVNGTQSTRAAELADKCECISNSELLNKLEYLRDIEIKKDNGLYSDNLFYQICEYGHCKWLFISHVNKSDNISREKYTVKITGEYSLTLYDTINGKRFNMPSHIENGYTIFNWNCYSEDSILLCCNDKKTEFAEYKADQEYKTVQRIRKITDYNRTEPNVLLLDYAQCSIDNGEILNREEILRVDNKIRKKLGFPEKTGHDRQPWATEEKETQSITLYYDIYSEISTSVQLGIENPENCCIYLNGAEADNTAVGWYVDKAIKIINLPDIQKGKNELKIEMQYNQKTMLENMYLLGDFGVKLDEDRAVISKERRSLNFGNITAQGMPFYTGNLEYMFTIDIDDSNEYFIHIPKFFAPVIGIYVDGKKRGLIAYAPHRLSLGKLEQGSHEIKVELYGNRYNGFGTLHNANENYVWYGNSSYRTTGEEWTDNYMLRPVGIMSAIEIEKIDNMPK